MTDELHPGPVRTGRLAGALYLLMMPFAMFSLYVRTMKVPGLPAGDKAANILASSDFFGAAIVTWLTAQVISVFLVVQLYRLLKPVNETHALLMLALALIGVPIVCFNETHQFAVLLLVQDLKGSADTDHLLAEMMFHLRMHERGIAVAHVFWGLWLLPLGLLVFKSGFLPRWLGVLLLIAGLGYLFDFLTSVVSFVLPFPGWTHAPVTTFTFIGELILPLWLLIRGVRPKGQQPA